MNKAEMNKKAKEIREEYKNSSVAKIQYWGYNKDDEFFQHIAEKKFEEKWGFNKSYKYNGKKVREEMHSETGEIRYRVTNPKTGNVYIRRKKDNI